MHLEIIILSEVRKQRTNPTQHDLYVDSKNSTNEIIYKTETFTDIENTTVDAKREREQRVGQTASLGLQMQTIYT